MFQSFLRKNATKRRRNVLAASFVSKLLMGKVKFSPELKGRVFQLLDQNMSYSSIIKILKSYEVSISKGQISRIKNGCVSSASTSEGKENRGRKSTLSKMKLQRLKKMVENPNPPTQTSMAKQLSITRRVIQYSIDKKTWQKICEKTQSS